MKKIIVMFLMLMLLGCISPTVFAEETESKTEISFRDIPWYTSAVEFEELYKDDVLAAQGHSSSEYVEHYKNMEYQNPDNIFGYPYSKASKKEYDESIHYEGFLMDYNVAGYPVTHTKLDFIYSIGLDGQVDYSKEHTTFYSGEYIFSEDAERNDYVDILSVYNDLYIKLSSLYGEPTYAEEDDDSAISFWFDVYENSIVMQCRYGEVSIKYFRGGMINRIDKLHEAMDKALEDKQKSDVSDTTDGL